MRFDKPLRAEKLVSIVKRKFLWLIPYNTTASDWRVLEDFRFFHDDVNPTHFMWVKAGLETDLASVPGFFGFVIQKDGDFAQAAVNHDNSYQHRGNVVYRELEDGSYEKLGPLTRAEQDRAFYEGMKILGTSPPIRVVMWRAVRRFGWISYPKEEPKDA